MKELLGKVKEDATEIEDVRVVLPEGKVVYDLAGAVSDGNIPPRVLLETDFSSAAAGRPYAIARYGGKYNIFLPIHDRQNAWIGSLCLVFDESIVNSHSSFYIKQNIREMVVVAAIAVVLMMVALFAFPVVKSCSFTKR